jgi:hypothetical protein
MFEKEAEEYVNTHVAPPFSISEQDLYDCFQRAATFGYNKANEWHKQEVDDIYDLISEDWSVRYFICIMKDKSRVTAIGNCDEDNNGGVSINLFFEHDDEKYYIDDIVWWKEIVLPKESE